MSALLSLGQQPPLQIIHEDSALIAVAKPAGQLFHGYTHGLPSPLVDQVKAYLQERYGKSEGVYLGVIHRLDRPVSGLALFARQSKAAARLAAQFQERTLDKWYLALVEGVPPLEEENLEDLLDIPATDRQPARQQWCSLRYRRLAVDAGHALLAVRLGTGRRHQIRIQLSRRGWPLLGDVSYGASAPWAETLELDPRFRPIGLHAASLRFQHPRDFTSLALQAPLPAHWQIASSPLLTAAAAFLAAAPDVPLATV